MSESNLSRQVRLARERLDKWPRWLAESSGSNACVSNFKVATIRSEKHKAFVRSHDCLLERNGKRCNGTPVIAHHFTFIKGEGGISKKAADIYTVPLCFFHHGVLHHMGEKSFWKSWHFGLSELEYIASEFCKQSPCSKVKND